MSVSCTFLHNFVSPQNALAAARVTRAGRLVRILRVIRLIRLIKLWKAMEDSRRRRESQAVSRLMPGDDVSESDSEFDEADIEDLVHLFSPLSTGRFGSFRPVRKNFQTQWSETRVQGP